MQKQMRGSADSHGAWFSLLPKSKLSVKPLAIFCGYTARFVSDLGPPKTGFVMSQVHFNRGFKISRIQFLMPVAWGIEVISGFASFAHGFRISRYTGSTGIL